MLYFRQFFHFMNTSRITQGCVQTIEERIQSKQYGSSLKLIKSLRPSSEKDFLVGKVFRKMEICGWVKHTQADLVLLIEVLLMIGDVESSKKVLPFIDSNHERTRLQEIVAKAIETRIRLSDSADFSI